MGDEQMDYRSEYRSKCCTPQRAVQLVRDGDWVDYTHGITFPQILDQALAERTGELKDVKIRCMFCLKRPEVMERDPHNVSFTYHTWHSSSVDRRAINEGHAYFTPVQYSQLAEYYRRRLAPVDVVMMTVSPMDRHGNFSFACNPSATQGILDAADRIILEVNPNLPEAYGLGGDFIHISDVDAIVESDAPVLTAPNPPVREMDKKIASYLFPYLKDGMTLQIGVGGIPNALGTLIADSDLKDLGMHTEYLSDGYLKLYESGKITDRRKELLPGKGVYGTCAGSPDLYDFVDHNRALLSAPIEFVNHMDRIRQLDQFVSINGCLAVDLYGQVCSESAGLRHISGSGGQVDFINGAFWSAHGQAFLTMPSTYTDRQGIVHSRIQPYFSHGDIITTARAVTPSIVTEYGVAELVGKTTWQRAEALIAIAHPDFRESLIRAAEAQHIWRPSCKR